MVVGSGGESLGAVNSIDILTVEQNNENNDAAERNQQLSVRRLKLNWIGEQPSVSIPEDMRPQP